MRCLKKRAMGMVLVEVLLVAAVAAFISLVGCRLVFLLLDTMEARNRLSSERIAQDQLQSAVRRVWRERASHPFQRGDWLSVKGVETENVWLLERFELRCHAEGGRVGRWILEKHNGNWVHFMDFPDAGMPPERERFLLRGGTILIEISKPVWAGGEVPEQLTWRFPDASLPELQEGFAIRNL